MKFDLALTLVMAATLVGCSKSKKSHPPQDGVTVQGLCSRSTIDLHRYLVRQSEKSINNRTDVRGIYQSCESLRLSLGGNSCQDESRSNQHVRFISYADVSNYCSEVEAYLNQRPPPKPVPVPPKQRNVLIEDLNNSFGLYFERSYLEQGDLDLRNGQTRCQLSVPNQINGNLRNIRASFVSITIRTTPNSTTYDIITAVSGARELLGLTCRSHSSRLTVQDVNRVLDGVAELRQRR